MFGLDRVPTDDLFGVLCDVENARDKFDHHRVSAVFYTWGVNHTQVLIAWTARERERMKHLVPDKQDQTDADPPRGHPDDLDLQRALDA